MYYYRIYRQVKCSVRLSNISQIGKKYLLKDFIHSFKKVFRGLYASS